MNAMIMVDQHRAWFDERERLRAFINVTEQPSAAVTEACRAMSDIERTIISTPTRSLAANHLRCLLLLKLISEGFEIADEDADRVVRETDYLMQEARQRQAAEQAAFDAALAEYRRLRAIAEAMDSSDPAVDRAVELWTAAMDVLIDETRAPNIAALRIKIALLEERYEGFCDWGGSERAIHADLDHLERMG